MLMAMDVSFLDLIERLNYDHTISFKKEFGQVAITLKDDTTNKEVKSILPLDHHMSLSRIKSCIEFMENKMKQNEKDKK